MTLKTFTYTSYFLFIAILSCLILSSTVYAEKQKNDIFSRFKKPMPELELLSEEEFYKATKPVKKMPYGQDVLEYTIRIPKNWTEAEDRSSSNFVLSEKLFLKLNVFYSKPRTFGRSRIEVEALNMEGSLTAEQWYLKYILEEGYTTEAFVVHDENKVESLMVQMEKDYPYYVRTLVLLNGNKVIMVKYFVPTRYIKEEAPMQEQVLKSFKLMNYVERVPEKTSIYRFLDIAELTYPATWRAYPEPLREINRMAVTLLSFRQVGDAANKTKAVSTEGKLEVTVIAASQRSSLIDEIKAYRQKIEAKGILVGSKIDVDDEFSYGENIDFAITEVYHSIDSNNNLSDYEIWFTVMVGGNYYYFFNLLTPSRNEQFGVWAKNTQSYKEILKNFNPMSGAFLERD